ncbi:hypothetical protein SLEP1_g23157 [Rubroshorea leprosula]|uniref:Survival protein SurE-like phosphatase/nucleotidase domain-containing protein n=1 Tax=Rubroshorea leprosula TaxID=152421 RepID=A0AAV5JIQ9_9ROSI|nr:hypothetical protein SLEP1_g23157 [Rubroshorea leprosula]
MATSLKNNFLPPSLISNLHRVLITRDNDVQQEYGESFGSPLSSSSNGEPNTHSNHSKPVVLVTNGEAIDSPGLTFLAEAVVLDGSFSVHVCAPHLDKSASSHSVTIQETITVSLAEISGAIAYEVSGTPVDCISLALSGMLFSWSRPVFVISGINRGSSCGHNMFHSGAIAAAQEAVISGVPSLCLSLNCCLLNIEIPPSPLTNKGFKLTKQSPFRSSLSWKPVSANRHAAAPQFMSNQQSLGIKLSRDASVAGAARRLNSRYKQVEIESVGVAGKNPDPKTEKR